MKEKEREREREREGARKEKRRAVPGLGMAYDRFLLETHE